MIIRHVLFLNSCFDKVSLEVKSNREYEIIFKWSFPRFYLWTHRMTKYGWKWNGILNVKSYLNDHSPGSICELIEWQNTDGSEMKHWMWNHIWMIIPQVLFLNSCFYRAHMKVKSNTECEIIIKWSFSRFSSWIHVLTKSVSKWNQIENMKSYWNDDSPCSIPELMYQ